MIEDAEYTVIDKLNGFLYFSIGNKLYTYRKGIDECVEVNLQGVNFDPIVSLNVIAHNDYKANIFVAIAKRIRVKFTDLLRRVLIVVI